MLQSKRSQPCPFVLVGDLERFCSRMRIRVLAIPLREPGYECLARTGRTANALRLVARQVTTAG